MGKIIVKVIHDEDATSPRDYDNIGTMVCWHRRYNLGDEQPSVEPSEYLAELPEGAEILPLYLYDHSGITMSTGSFGCAWDSGQVGFIYTTPERIRAEFGDDSEESRKKVREILESEVKCYDAYIQGDTWGYVVEREPDPCEHCGLTGAPESEDSCWGFLNVDSVEGGSALDAMKDHIPTEWHAALEEAWEDRY